MLLAFLEYFLEYGLAFRPVGLLAEEATEYRVQVAGSFALNHLVVGGIFDQTDHPVLQRRFKCKVELRVEIERGWSEFALIAFSHNYIMSICIQILLLQFLLHLLNRRQ